MGNFFVQKNDIMTMENNQQVSILCLVTDATVVKIFRIALQTV